MNLDAEIEKLLKEYKEDDKERNQKLDKFLEVIDQEWNSSPEVDLSTDCHSSHSSHNSHSSHGSRW